MNPHCQLGKLNNPGFYTGLTCLARCLEVTVANRWSPGLMAR